MLNAPKKRVSVSLSVVAFRKLYFPVNDIVHHESHRIHMIANYEKKDESNKRIQERKCTASYLVQRWGRGRSELKRNHWHHRH
mmetsp:Transcript_1937/g.2157  ORF Transcript_1937/g.2157 Transcript_1937/m.2157 type:complete len:83 (+) Transcript_1937:227-475(+)